MPWDSLPITIRPSLWALVFCKGSPWSVVAYFFIVFVVVFLLSFIAFLTRNVIRKMRYHKLFLNSDPDSDHLIAHRGMSKNLITGKATSTRSPLYK